jgi:hypothetical protein
MSVEAVISCPRCLRQYAVDPSLGGRIGQCEACKSTFSISLVEVAIGEPAVSLIEPLTLRYNFIADPVTPLAITKIVMSMPRYHDFSYFCRSIPRKSFDALDTLEGAVVGVLSVGFDNPTLAEMLRRFEPAPPCKDLVVIRRRGPLERFAERMGW